LVSRGLIWPLDWTCRSCGHTAPVLDGIALTAPALANTISGFDPADFAFLAEVERWHFWFVARRALIVALTDSHAPLARQFIEIGCGSGNVIEALTSARSWTRIVGTDIHPKGLALARSRLSPAVELVQVDARELPFHSAFDLAGVFDVLEHIAEDELVITRIRDALVDRGVLIAAVPQHPSLWSAADEVGHHVRRYRRGELEAKLSASGFDIAFSTSYAVALLPLMALNRILVRQGSRDVDARTIARREFDVAPRLNRLLTAILSAEISLTRRGVRWPIGGSRVVVARKR
jgi:SAM-dependent methyltransferase